jgi:hypothetical protein
MSGVQYIEYSYQANHLQSKCLNINQTVSVTSGRSNIESNSSVYLDGSRSNNQPKPSSVLIIINDNQEHPNKIQHTEVIN